MTDVQVALGTPNGNGKFHVLYQHDGREYLDSLDGTSGHQREQSIKRMSLQFGLKPENVKDLDGQLQQLVKEFLAQSKNGDKLIGHPVLVKMNTVEAKPVDWLWDKRIALGKLTLWAGNPGLGKSMATIDIMARVSANRGFPDGSPTCGAAGCVLITCEDDPADTIRPRLDIAGADTSRITLVQSVTWFESNRGRTERQFDLERDLPALEEAIEATENCRLVTIDPIMAYSGGKDSHKDSDIRALLSPVVVMAQQHHVAVVGVMHLNKSNLAAINRISGSMAFVAAARAVWVVDKDRRDPERRIVACLKNNLAKDTVGMAYRLEDIGGLPRIDWEPTPIRITADELLAPDRSATKNRIDKHHEVDAWLEKLLKDGPIATTEITAKAEGAGLTWRSVRSAQERLGIVPEHAGGRGTPWTWGLPLWGQESGQRCQVSRYSEIDKIDTFEPTSGGQEDS